MENRKGFTILEVLIAVVIVTVGLVATSMLQDVSTMYNYNSHKMTIATILAQHKIEELVTQDWDSDDLSDREANVFKADNSFNWTVQHDHADTTVNYITAGTAPVAEAIDENGNFTASVSLASGYYREWNIADDVPATYMKTISVRVRWGRHSPAGVSTNSITVNTVLSEG